jgi:hypothetical protein
MRMPLGAADVSQIPDDFELPVLGSAAEVRERIHQVLQAVDWDDPEWGRLEGMGWSMELNLGRDDPADSLMLHVRGGGDGAVEAVQLVAGALDADPVDMSTGAPVVPAGWEEWQLYRDRTIGQ